jgi:uncharacterized protein YchJ
MGLRLSFRRFLRVLVVALLCGGALQLHAVAEAEPEALLNQAFGQVNAQKEWIKLRVSNISMFRNLGKDDMVVVTFEQDYRSSNLSNQMKKRQYWIKEDRKWRIVYEGAA